MDHDPLAAIQAGAEEVHRDASYAYDNARRGDPDRIVAQLTLAGAAFWRDARGLQLVPVDHAMLFTHREPTAYGYPPDASEPYRHRFLALSRASSIQGVFEMLRRDFGSVVRLAPDGEALALFEELGLRFQRRTFQDRYHESELIYRFFIALYREQVRGTRTTDPIEFGLHFMRNRFRTPLSLKEVAAKCGVSREHFAREFSRRYGEPPAGFLRRLRLDHARAMLQATEFPIEKIALASGFASESSFRRAFRGATGHAPRHR